MYRTTRRLSLTRDGRRVVPAGHPDGHTLFAPAGTWLPDVVAARYDLPGLEERMREQEHGREEADKAMERPPRTAHIPGPPETTAIRGPEETQVVSGPPETAVIRRAQRKGR